MIQLRSIMLAITVMAACSVCNFCSAQIAFTPYYTIYSGASGLCVAIADVNGDNRNDVVMASDYNFTLNSYKIYVYAQLPSGALSTTPSVYSYTPANNVSPRAMVVADVNNDGRTDVITAFSDSISINYQNTSGTLDPPVRYYSGSNVEALRTGDLNNDGKTDIVTAHFSPGNIRVFYQGATGFTSATFGTPATVNNRVLEVGDVNGDGRADVVLLCPIFSPSSNLTGGIAVYTQTGSGSLNSYVTYNVPYLGTAFNSMTSFALGDLNHDGRIDIAGTVSGNSPNARYVLWYQDTTTHLLQPGVSKLTSDIPEPVAIADLNCDGNPELISAHGGWLHLSVDTLNAAGVFGTYHNYGITPSSHFSPYGLAVADFTGDGRKDVALADDNYGLVLLKNVSTIPSAVTSSSTTTKIDSFYRTKDTASSLLYNRNFVFNSGIYTIRHTDTFLVFYTHRTDSVKYDTTIIRSAVVCGGAVVDTLNSSIKRVFYSNPGDTQLIYERNDTLAVGVASVQLPATAIYPNPTTRFCTITDFESTVSTQTLELIITNALGQKLNSTFTTTHGGSQLHVDLSGFPSGVYFVLLGNGNTVYRGKILKL